MTQTITHSASKGIYSGLLGGFIAAIIMGGIAYMMPIPNTGGAPFFVAAAMMMGMGTMALVTGWMLHLITGGIFGAITGKASKLRSSSVARGVGLGILAGIVVWILLFMPMMASLMPVLMSMGTMVVGSFAAHVIYGLILGGVVGALSHRATVYKCEACSASFSGQEDLMKHGKEHMKIEEQYKCSACGTTFRSQSELMDHAKKEHPEAVPVAKIGQSRD